MIENMHMTSELLAKSDLDQWIQIIIVILVFGGSALGAISKKLIQIFTPKDDAVPLETVKPAQKKRASTKPTARRVDAPPVARPRVRPPGEPMPPGIPPPLEQLVRQLGPLAKPAPPRPQPTRTPPAPAQARKPAKKKRRPLGSLKTLEPTVDDHLDRLGSEVRAEVHDFDAEVADQPALRSAKLARTKRVVRPSTHRSSANRLRGLPRNELRRAILLREILGPPVAIDAPVDRF